MRAKSARRIGCLGVEGNGTNQKTYLPPHQEGRKKCRKAMKDIIMEGAG